MTPALAKELVEALEALVTLDVSDSDEPRGRKAWARARAVLARAKAETGAHEFTVTDDGHGRAMVGGRRLAFGGAGLMVGDFFKDFGATKAVGLDIGTRVRVELREGVDFATLLEVLS